MGTAVTAIVNFSWSMLILYSTFVGDNEAFSKEAFAQVHEEGSVYEGRMTLFLIHNPKYLTPFMIGLANVYAAYNFAVGISPPGVKWFYIVWRREALKQMSVEHATNILEAVDAAADNMRVWYMHVVVASFFCALLVSPRAAGVCMAIFSLSRLMTPFGMMVMNPIPQTALMFPFTLVVFRFML